MWPSLTDNTDPQAIVNHFQFSVFWMEGQVFHLFHWRDNPVLDIPGFSGDLWPADLHTVLSILSEVRRVTPLG